MGRTWHDILVTDVEINYHSKELNNYNSQRYRIATVSHDGSKWVVDQKLYGPVTMNNDLVCKGIKSVGPSWTPTPPSGATHLEDWEGTWSGYTKDGIPAYPSTASATQVEYLSP